MVKNSREFHPWVKQVEKFCKLTNVPANSIKLVAYNASRGAVSNFLATYLSHLETQSFHDGFLLLLILPMRLFCCDAYIKGNQNLYNLMQKGGLNWQNKLLRV